MNLDELLADAKAREEEYPDGMYLALYREGMLDSQIIEKATTDTAPNGSEQ